MTTIQTVGADIALDVCAHRGRTWLARVLGVKGDNALDMGFIAPTFDGRSQSRRAGTLFFEGVTDGVYVAYEPRSRRRGLFFLIVRDGEYRVVSRDEALATIDTGGK